MATFTLVNLGEVPDRAGAAGLSAIQEARFARGDLGCETIGLALQRIKPGRRQGFAHRHKRAEEVYVVLSGSGRMLVDDKVLTVSPLDAIRVEPSVVRAFEAGPQGLELIVFGPHHEGDAELLQEHPWPH
ncbi:MAG TPA: cupin domain-containing protein [Solirubrobacteraceae bacterium]|nr:cupin domain-containing protein [Solirubrobacteraceae bacterium]